MSVVAAAKMAPSPEVAEEKTPSEAKEEEKTPSEAQEEEETPSGAKAKVNGQWKDQEQLKAPSGNELSFRSPSEAQVLQRR